MLARWKAEKAAEKARQAEAERAAQAATPPRKRWAAKAAAEAAAATSASPASVTPAHIKPPVDESPSFMRAALKRLTEEGQVGRAAQRRAYQAKRAAERDAALSEESDAEVVAVTPTSARQAIRIGTIEAFKRKLVRIEQELQAIKTASNFDASHQKILATPQGQGIPADLNWPVDTLQAWFIKTMNLAIALNEAQTFLAENPHILTEATHHARLDLAWKQYQFMLKVFANTLWNMSDDLHQAAEHACHQRNEQAMRQHAERGLSIFKFLQSHGELLSAHLGDDAWKPDVLKSFERNFTQILQRPPFLTIPSTASAAETDDSATDSATHSPARLGMQ